MNKDRRDLIFFKNSVVAGTDRIVKIADLKCIELIGAKKYCTHPLIIPTKRLYLSNTILRLRRVLDFFILNHKLMKLTTKTVVLFGILSLGIISCKKEVNDSTFQQEEISQTVIDKISALGFTSSHAQKVEEGYLVEGDIILTDADLNSAPQNVFMRIANDEQYRTNNLVTGLPRVITVSSSGNVNAAVSNAINAAIARYNAENLGLTFQRVSSGGNINVRVVVLAAYIASAGFPTGGNPYHEVKFNRQYQNYSAGFLTTVLAHEIGHCIGFRHTDYMSRQYSCGGAASNEGASNVGAVHIPGTPTGPDALSWMLACLSSTTDRPFNTNDRTALNYLY